MKVFLTEFYAIDYHANGRLKLFAGPNIEAPTWQLAQAECDKHYPYLRVVGELVATIDADDVQTDYNHSLN